MSRCFISLILLILTSCSSNDDINNVLPDESLENIVKFSYTSDGPQGSGIEKLDVFKVDERIVQLSPSEEIEILYIRVSSEKTEDYISLHILSNSIGRDVLYDNKFYFKVKGTGFIPLNAIDLEVIVNNSNEFYAKFSGTLKHWSNNNQVYRILNITNGLIKIKF